MKYTCLNTDYCDRNELFDLLQEMDRRYFLLQNFRWEFSSLDYSQTDTISENNAKWFVQNVHGEYFSSLNWDTFLRTRNAPTTGVNFPEIEVMLCNIPSREEYLLEQAKLKKLAEGLFKYFILYLFSIFFRFFLQFIFKFKMQKMVNMVADFVDTMS